jgi:hypothetical protein
MEWYDGEGQSNIPVHEFEHITLQSGIRK